MNTLIDKAKIEKQLIALVKEIMDDPKITLDPRLSLIEDYGLDSLDLLDLSFNIEEIFNVKIGKNELAGRAEQTMSKEEMFDENGCISKPALEEMKRNIPEIPAAKIVYGIKQADIPRLLNISVFTRIIFDKLTGTTS